MVFCGNGGGEWWFSNGLRLPHILPTQGTYLGSRLHVFIAHSRHSSSPKDHELTKLQPPNDFKIRSSDDLHVKILLQYFELIGKHCG